MDLDVYKEFFIVHYKENCVRVSKLVQIKIVARNLCISKSLHDSLLLVVVKE
jgi:hypothetical protein